MGLFVNTLQKISSRLDDSDIDNRLIYGETPVDVRKDFIADFRNPNGPAVLVSNFRRWANRFRCKMLCMMPFILNLISI